MNMAPTQMNMHPSQKQRPEAPKRKSRSPWFAVTLTAWLLFLSIVVAGGVVEYRRQAPEPGDKQRIDELAGRVDEMAVRQQNETASLRESVQFEMAAVRQPLEEQAAAISGLANQAAESAEAFAALKDQVNALEAKAAQRQTVISSTSETTRPQPAPRPMPSIKPPFQVIGVEQRGIEQFLTVMRAGGQSVEDIQLLRVGTRFGLWFLEGIEAEHAVFRVEDATVRLPIPRLPVVPGGA